MPCEFSVINRKNQRGSQNQIYLRWRPRALLSMAGCRIRVSQTVVPGLAEAAAHMEILEMQTALSQTCSATILMHYGCQY